MSANLKDDILRAAEASHMKNRNDRRTLFSEGELNKNYIFDISYAVRPDDSLYVREVSLVPNQQKGATMKSTLPYTHNKDLNTVVTELMNDWSSLVEKAKRYGMDIRFAPNCTETLELYFHDDYPDTLLVDKDISCKLKGE